MATNIQLKRSATPGNTPTDSDLLLGELAINTHDGVVFFKQDRNGRLSIRELETSTTAENVFYVSKSGSDSNDGTSLAKAFLTLDKALETVQVRRGAAGLDSDGAQGSVFLTQTRRDLNYYISASVYDIVYGTKFNRVFQGRAGSYTNGFEEVLVSLRETKRLTNQLSQVAGDLDATNNNSAYWDEVIDIVEGGKDEADTLDVAAYPLPLDDTYYIASATQSSTEIKNDASKTVQILAANKVFISEEVNFWARVNFPGVTYDEEKCKRDVRFAIEAIMYDAAYLGNSATWQNANFFHYDNIEQIPEDQKGITVGAYRRLKEVIAIVLNQQTLTPLSGDTLGESYTVAQDTVTASPPDASKILTVSELADIIADTIQSGTSALPTRVDPEDNTSEVDFNTMPTALRLAKNQIEAQKESVIDDVVDYINQQFPLLFYNIGDRYVDVLDAPEQANTIKVMTGDYTINNPVTVPANTSIVGDNLKNTSIRPLNKTQDMFYLHNNCYLYGMTFRDNLQPGAVVAWDPSEDSTSNIIINSPYIQNCSTITGPDLSRNFDGTYVYADSNGDPLAGGDGIRNDGNHAGGIRSMVVDSFTQITQGGKGVYLKNKGYCQLVSMFTVYCDIGFFAENGGFASISNSNSSFGNIGVKATGVSAENYRGRVNGNQDILDNVVQLKELQTRPLISDAVKFASDPLYFTVDSSSWDSSTGLAEIKLLEVPDVPFVDNDLVTFHQRSALSSSGHTFEWVGTGTDVRTAFPYRGGQPNQADEVVQDENRAGLCFVTSTDQKGDFRVGEDFLIQRSTGTIEGLAFDRSLFARVTPFSLALED